MVAKCEIIYIWGFTYLRALDVQVVKDATTTHHSLIVGNLPCVWPPRVPNKDCALGSPVSLSAMLECLAATVRQLVGAFLNVEENTLPAEHSLFISTSWLKETLYNIRLIRAITRMLGRHAYTDENLGL